MPLVARVYAMQTMYNWTKDIFKNPIGYENELLSICCVTKTMFGWTSERVATVCRERCGGMGYLASSRFADHLAGAHSMLTAEGDNRVLMVKVCKDMFANVSERKYTLPEPQLNVVTQIGTFNDVTQIDTIVDLFRFREKTLYHRMTKIMADRGMAGKNKYQILMRETSDVM